MKKIDESLKVKSLSQWLVIGIVAIVVLAVGGVVAVKAYNGQLFGDCNNCTINVGGAIEAVGDALLGASELAFLMEFRLIPHHLLLVKSEELP